RRVHQRVVERPGHARAAIAAATSTTQVDVAGQAGFQTLPVRLADVCEIALIGDGPRADEENVIGVPRVERRQRVVDGHALSWAAAPGAAYARLQRAGHDGREGRIGDEAIRQATGSGRAGAGELDGGRGAVRFAVAG